MRRVEEHPILGPSNKGREVIIQVDGKSIPAYEGESVAAALTANGITVFRRTSRFNSPRYMFCGIGQCTDCSMIVNGVPNVRTCVTRVTQGMIIETQTGTGALIPPAFSKSHKEESGKNGGGKYEGS